MPLRPLLFAVCLSSVVWAPSVLHAQGTDADAATASAETNGRQGRSGFEEVPQSGGPSSVGAQLREDDEVRETVFRTDALQRWLKPYFDWKGRLVENHGLALGTDYTALYYGASGSPGEDRAASGIFRLFGSWTAVGRGGPNTGSAVFKVENRHAYGSNIPVSALGFETGYVGLVGPPFNDRRWMLTNFYWQQKALDGRMTINVGLVDATDYVDVYGLISPWMHFNNLVFTTGGGSIPVPDQGLGLGVGAMLTDRAYVIAGVADANGDPTDPGGGFDTFFNENEYYSHVELGLTTSQQELYLNNVHLTLWHADERQKAAVSGGWGATFSAAHFFSDRWMPFLRAGYADQGGSLLSRTVSTGVGYYMRERSDLLGFGLNWGRPNQDTFAPGLSDQVTAELFYRAQLSPNFAITPDIQYIVDPALNPSASSTWVLGLRARLTL